jgi:hypothetical protein
MNITLGLAPLVSLAAGILILVVPRLLNYIVAIYLIVIGLIGIFGAGNFRMRLLEAVRVVLPGHTRDEDYPGRLSGGEASRSDSSLTTA